MSGPDLGREQVVIPAAFGGNRAERRAKKRGLAHNGQAGKPVTVSREIPVSVMQHADGTREVINHEQDEPCYDCRCCLMWARSLDTLAGAIKAHDEQDHSRFVTPGNVNDEAETCLVCAMLLGLLDGQTSAG